MDALGPRIQNLNSKPLIDGEYVLYWMQQSQRAEENHALEYAIRKANKLGLPVVVVFGLAPKYPEANLRHYIFMLQGLREVRWRLSQRKILFVVQHGEPPETALRLGRLAACIICDRGYLRHQRRWREQVAKEAGCLVEQVECDAIVPVDAASTKLVTSARAFRPKVMRLHPIYLDDLNPARSIRNSIGLQIESLDLDDEDAVLGPLELDRSVKPVPLFTGGTSAAKRRLADFLRTGLAGYAEYRNQPQTEYISHMSPYLHFGQISPMHIAYKIQESGAGSSVDRESYLDELIVQRELSINFVYFSKDYDEFICLPQWARATLNKHKGDLRPKIYSKDQLENAHTHDPWWNAAMNEMKIMGYMHNHMRMYWGKQILTWSRTPQMAYKTALDLNNKYFIDGRDPSSYANIGWIFGLHDRPWPEREVFGSVRSMTAGGLMRKTDPEAYVEKIEKLRFRNEHSTRMAGSIRKPQDGSKRF
jgi:deoxyribodipyrimidine photo-lyase